MDKKLRGIAWDHVRGYGPLEASVKPYKERTGVNVHWDKRSLKDFGDASLELLAREYDLIIMDHPHCGTASATRCILPLDEILAHDELLDTANCVGPSFDSYFYAGHQWALPVDAACQVSCRRPDLFGDSALPKSWSDVFELAQMLKSKRQFIGMALCPTDCNCSFLTLCAQFGSPVRENKFTTVDVGLEALRTLQKLHAVSHPECLSWNPVKLYDHMSTKTDVVYAPLGFGYTNYSRKSYSTYQLAFGEIPGGHSAILGGAGIAVSVHTKLPDAATAYAAWLCGERYQSTEYVTAGGQPAHKKAWTNEGSDVLTGGFFTGTRTTIETAYVRPRNLKWPLFQESLGDIIHDSLTIKKSIEQTWRAIEDTYAQYYE